MPNTMTLIIESRLEPRLALYHRSESAVSGVYFIARLHGEPGFCARTGNEPLDLPENRLRDPDPLEVFTYASVSERGTVLRRATIALMSMVYCSTI